MVSNQKSLSYQLRFPKSIKMANKTDVKEGRIKNRSEFNKLTVSIF